MKNVLLKKYLKGMLNKKLARKTFDRISLRPGGFQSLCNEDGYEECLKITLDAQALTGFASQLFDEMTTSIKGWERYKSVKYDKFDTPMDTSSIQNKFRGQRSANTTNNVNPQDRGRPTSTQGPNPPAGAQKKLQQQARTQKKQSQPLDMSKIKCFKCDNVGHWARDCNARANGPVNSTVTTIVPEKQTWSDVSIVSSVVSSIPQESQDGQTISSWADDSTNPSHPN